MSAGTAGNLDLFGQVVHFYDGGALPSGAYSLRYVDGCMKYNAGQSWTVNAYSNGSIAWWLVGATSADLLAVLPGTSGYSVATGAFASFDACVAANLQVPPLIYQHDGGPLGIWLRDTPYTDNVAGVNGRNPRWHLAMCQ